jgi:large subunit ribosomal protein L3
MCKGLVGKKLGMTSVFGPNGKYIPVTVLQVGPCVVTQIKKGETDGYSALQLGFGLKKEKKTTKPLQGHFKKAGKGFFSSLKEVGVENPNDYSLGQTIGPEIFAVGEKVNVTGITKGRGFSGVIASWVCRRTHDPRLQESSGARFHRLQCYTSQGYQR